MCGTAAKRKYDLLMGRGETPELGEEEQLRHPGRQNGILPARPHPPSIRFIFIYPGHHSSTCRHFLRRGTWLGHGRRIGLLYNYDVWLRQQRPESGRVLNRGGGGGPGWGWGVGGPASPRWTIQLNDCSSRPSSGGGGVCQSLKNKTQSRTAHGELKKTQQKHTFSVCCLAFCPQFLTGLEKLQRLKNSLQAEAFQKTQQLCCLSAFWKY